MNYEAEVRKVYPNAYISVCPVMFKTYFIAVPNIGKITAFECLTREMAWANAYNQLVKQNKIIK